MKSRQQGLTQETSAAKADISERTGRRLEKEGFPKPIKRHWNTRKDPLVDIWDSELLPMLELESTLTGLTLWEYFTRKNFFIADSKIKAVSFTLFSILGNL